MKIIVLFAFFALTAADTHYFKTANDHLDMEAVVADLPKLQSFVDCFMDKGPCTELTKSYKIIIAEAVKTACGRCNNAQKHLSKVFLGGLKANLPQEYKNFRHKYDPENVYFDKLEKAVANY